MAATAEDDVTGVEGVAANAGDEDDEMAPLATGKNGSSALGSIDAIATPVEGYMYRLAACRQTFDRVFHLHGVDVL